MANEFKMKEEEGKSLGKKVCCQAKTKTTKTVKMCIKPLMPWKTKKENPCDLAASG